jgi:hypothetical protein
VLPVRSSVALGALGVAFTTLSAAGVAGAAGPREAQAKKALKKALDEDYLETRFDDAERRLRKALEACGASGCSAQLKARLHAAIGAVLAGGKKELEDARDEFVEALTLDPRVEPDPGVLSTEVSFAFEQAQKRRGGKAAKPTGKTPEPPPEPPPEPDAPKDEPAAAKEPAPDRDAGDARGPAEQEAAPPPAPARKNWISITFSPDFSVVSGSNVCAQDSQANAHYICGRADATSSRYAGTPTPNNGDNINTGIALSTIRLMLGYDRLLVDNLTLGVRAGFAFNGAGVQGASFLPVHLEARLGAWLRHTPFVAAVVRPYFMLSGGVAQVDTKVPVQVLEDGTACAATPPGKTSSPCTQQAPGDNLGGSAVEPRTQTLSAYHQAGLGFGALSFGVQFAPAAAVGLFLAVRGSVTFPVLTGVISPEAGLAIGF